MNFQVMSKCGGNLNVHITEKRSQSEEAAAYYVISTT